MKAPIKPAEQETSAPTRRLICSCCGAETRGRQWHNRDTGYGLCTGCIEFCAKRSTPAEFERCYGRRGVHFDVQGAREGLSR